MSIGLLLIRYIMRSSGIVDHIFNFWVLLLYVTVFILIYILF